MEIKDCRDNLVLVRIGQIIEKWEANQSVANIFGHWQVAVAIAEFLAHFRGMQWHVVENRKYFSVLQVLDKQLSFIQRGHQ
jgi:hypothetical protein